MMRRTETTIGAVAPRAAMLAALAGLAVLLAGCSNATSTGSASPPATAPASIAAPSTVSPSTATSASVAAAAFADIVEPWDPGHPARTQTAPADCDAQPSTMAIEQCYEAKTENADAAIDDVQQGKFAAASPSARTAILAQDHAWLAARGPVCEAGFTTGGTIDGINVSGCLLDESTARLSAVNGIVAPEAVLKSTDNATDPGALAWYTTPEGSRIAELDTQGDQSGGAIIAWIIIGGADGFVVNPSQFYFSDGSFTDPGVVQPPSPDGHRVGPGQQYQFDIDYTHLSAAPAGHPAEGFVYAPGAPVASWR